MKYMIAYLLKGEPAFYHKNLSTELANVFNMPIIVNRIPPHLTLKAPFDARQIPDLERLIANFSAKQKPAPLLMEGYGHFDRRVLFMNVQPSQEAVKLIADLYTELKKLPWLNFERTDVQTAQAKKLHATLAYGESRRLFEELWNYIKDEKGRFEFNLDSIAILEREKDKWTIHSEHPFPSELPPIAQPQPEVQGSEP